MPIDDEIREFLRESIDERLEVIERHRKIEIEQVRLQLKDQARQDLEALYGKDRSSFIELISLAVKVGGGLAGLFALIVTVFGIKTWHDIEVLALGIAEKEFTKSIKDPQGPYASRLENLAAEAVVNSYLVRVLDPKFDGELIVPSSDWQRLLALLKEPGSNLHEDAIRLLGRIPPSDEENW